MLKRVPLGRWTTRRGLSPSSFAVFVIVILNPNIPAGVIVTLLLLGLRRKGGGRKGGGKKGEEIIIYEYKREYMEREGGGKKGGREGRRKERKEGGREKGGREGRRKREGGEEERWEGGEEKEGGVSTGAFLQSIGFDPVNWFTVWACSTSTVQIERDLHKVM